MKLLPRVLIVLALGWLGYVLFCEARSTTDADPTKLIVCFAGIIIITMIAGTIITLAVAPAIGDRVGSFFFNPGVEMEKDPRADAIAKVAQGDYHGAISEYEKLHEKDPSDTHALSEIARIYCDKIGDNRAAMAVLQGALQREWPANQSVFLASRLVDVYWDYERNAPDALALLSQIIETVPGTKYAANATHRSREIGQAVALGQIPPPKGPIAVDDESAGAPDHGEI